jgi:MoxR-like ATPase
MRELIDRLRSNITSVYLGNPDAVDRIICSLIAKGHVLIEDVPGVGKTVLATALARSIDCSFSRIQLTPDMLPGDILGVTVFNRNASSGGSHTTHPHDAPGANGTTNGVLPSGAFEFKKGPIFANIVLADEINRTPPRTQTALLEAMNEGSVTVDGRTHRLELPFMIVATQNPDDFEGTYLLPENQLDRFLMRLSLGYPSPEDELRVLSQRPAEHSLRELQPVMNAQQVRDLQRLVDDVRVDRSLLDYIISLANATRKSPDLQLGLSPRGALSLAQAARATAVLAARDYVIPEDIISNVVPVCAHRIVTRNYALAGRRATEAAASVMERLMETIESPA